MQKPSKTTIKGMVLGAILMAGIFTLTPQSASGDLTALDKIGTIINIITEIRNLLLDADFGLDAIDNEVEKIEGKLDGTVESLITNINRNVTAINMTVNSPVFGNEEIKNEVRNIEGNVTEILSDIQDKKTFYRNVTSTDFASGTSEFEIEIALGTCVDVPSEHQAFNVEGMLVNAFGSIQSGESIEITAIVVKASESQSAVIDIDDLTLSPTFEVLAESGLTQLATIYKIEVFGTVDADADSMDDNGVTVTVFTVGEIPQGCIVGVEII